MLERLPNPDTASLLDLDPALLAIVNMTWGPCPSTRQAHVIPFAQNKQSNSVKATVLDSADVILASSTPEDRIR